MSRKVIKVKDVMRERHLELDGMATVREALDLMKEHDARMVIVNKRTENDAFGIVLLSDIVKKVLAKDRAPSRVNIYEIMSKPIIPVDPDLDVRYCARLFDRFDFSIAPVISGDEVVGIVSYSELVFQGLNELIE